MRSKNFALPGWLVCFGLTVLLGACGADASPTTQPAAAPTGGAISTLETAPPTTATPAGPVVTKIALTPGPTPYITPLPEEWQPGITSQPPPDQTTGCIVVGEYPYRLLSQQVQESRDIVQAQVTSIGALTWNTADGKAPPQACSAGYNQYSPVEVTIKEVYKGPLTPGTKLGLWLTGAPGSAIQANYDYFPKNGDALIFFLGEELNVRRDTAENPMRTRIVMEIYRAPSPGSVKWVSQQTSTPFTLEWLKALIKDPAIEPTPTPFPPPPTPYLKAGQTLQPASYYGLDKSVQIYIKEVDRNPPQVETEKPSSERFNRLVKAFDQPLKVNRVMTDYPYSSASISFSFELPDNSDISFVYFPETNTLMHQLKDYQNRVELTAPPELKAIFGL